MLEQSLDAVVSEVGVRRRGMLVSWDQIRGIEVLDGCALRLHLTTGRSVKLDVALAELDAAVRRLKSLAVPGTSIRVRAPEQLQSHSTAQIVIACVSAVLLATSLWLGNPAVLSGALAACCFGAYFYLRWRFVLRARTRTRVPETPIAVAILIVIPAFAVGKACGGEHALSSVFSSLGFAGASFFTLSLVLPPLRRRLRKAWEERYRSREANEPPDAPGVSGA